MNETVTQSSLKNRRGRITYSQAAARIFIFLAFCSFIELVYAIRTDDLFSCVYNSVMCAGGLALAVLLLLKRRDFLVPVLTGVTFIPTKAMNLIYGYKYGFIHIDYYQTELIELLNVCLFVTICVLLVVKSPRIKSFMIKKMNLWRCVIFLTVVNFYLDGWLRSDGIYKRYCNMEVLRLALKYVPYVPDVLIEIVVTAISVTAFEFAIWLFLFRWLAGPMAKKNKQKKFFDKNKNLPQPNYPQQNSLAEPEPQPIVPVQTSLDSVGQAELQLPKPVNSAVDEIAKAKNLLDSGAITKEEFEKIKADILSK